MHVLSSCTGNFLKHGCNASLVASSPSFSLPKRHQLKQSACKENFAKVIFYFFYLLHYNYRPVKIFVRSTDFLSCMHLYNNFNKKKSLEISEKRRAFWKNSWNKSSTEFGKEGFECCMMNWVHLFLSSGQHIFSILIQQIIRSCAFLINHLSPFSSYFEDFRWPTLLPGDAYNDCAITTWHQFSPIAAD